MGTSGVAVGALWSVMNSCKRSESGGPACPNAALVANTKPNNESTQLNGIDTRITLLLYYGNQPSRLRRPDIGRTILSQVIVCKRSISGLGLICFIGILLLLHGWQKKYEQSLLRVCH